MPRNGRSHHTGEACRIIEIRGPIRLPGHFAVAFDQHPAPPTFHEPIPMTRARADALLLLVALLWGTTFVAQKTADGAIGPIWFVALRFTIAAVFLLPLALREARRSQAAVAPRDVAGAALIGALLCLGCGMQQFAMLTTSAGNAGFLTAAYVVIVPFVAWGFSGRAPSLLVLAAATVTLGGAWLLSGGSAAPWSRGDVIVLASDLVWALHINLIAHFRGLAARPMFLSVMQCSITGALALPAALASEPLTSSALLQALPAIAYAGIVSSGIAFTLQIVAQRYTPPAEAALILSLESVFAAASGALLLGERMSLPAGVGALLILAGVGLAEAGPTVVSAITAQRPTERRVP
jgi:drug/metabolite transporter (DMT)-like permease